VASRVAVMSEQLGIVELGQVCVAMRMRNLDLFAALGSWVMSSRPGELQRLFAEACHRHAWHAELWEARTPAIRVAFPTPTEHAPFGAAESEGAADSDEARRDRYRAELSSLEEQLRSLRARIDPSLDPSTTRTIDLVGRDVVELAERLDALRTR
jgi:hypothetical protein